MEAIPKLLSALRKEMSQEAIAREIDASQALISRWERGQVAAGADTLVKLIRLAKERGIATELSTKEAANA